MPGTSQNKMLKVKSPISPLSPSKLNNYLSVYKQISYSSISENPINMKNTISDRHSIFLEPTSREINLYHNSTTTKTRKARSLLSITLTKNQEFSTQLNCSRKVMTIFSSSMEEYKDLGKIFKKEWKAKMSLSLKRRKKLRSSRNKDQHEHLIPHPFCTKSYFYRCF